MTDTIGTPPPGVIPYVDFHDGPRRILTVISEGSRLITSTSRPVVLVDGREYHCVWGPVTFEVPADRNVHIGGYILGGQTITGMGSFLLEPGNDEQIVFRHRSLSSIGEFHRLPPAQFGY